MTLVQWFVVPLLLHVLLVNAVGARNVLGRVASVRSGETRLADIAVSSGNWPGNLRKLGNNFDNQFEYPTLWYAVSAVALALGLVDVILVVLSSAFIVTRFIHSFIHTGSNRIPPRMFSFLAGVTLVTAMWMWLALRLYVIG
jgi:hypothetical protein